jgi:retron-type reverse transcriptase
LIRATRKEIDLCFRRFLIDAEDDFFPDPLRYKDMRHVAREVTEQVSHDIRAALQRLEKKHNSGYPGRRFFDWDVPKNHDVVRHGVCIHPFDRIVFNFILNRLVPLIEPRLSPARYSYRIADSKATRLFGRRQVENWLAFKADSKRFFDLHHDYECLVSTDVAGFYEYTHISHFRDNLRQIAGADTPSVRPLVELLTAFLKHFSPSRTEGIPQNYDPSSYLASAFLDFLDKELEARGFRHFRYVDDIKVACHDRRHAQRAILEIIHALRRFNLNLSTAKTEIWHRDGPEFA